MSIYIELGTKNYEDTALNQMCFLYGKVNNIPVIPVNNFQGPVLQEDIIFRRSTTGKFLRDLDCLINPNDEALTRSSDKSEIYRFCRQYNIPTPDTRIVNPNSLPEILKMIPQGVVLKSKMGVGPRTVILNSVETDVETLALQRPDEFVAQEKMRGQTVKCYGCLTSNFLYTHEEANDTQEPKKCPPNISKLCRFLLDKFNLAYSGFDFIVQDGIWFLIDINPTSGWKRMPFKVMSQLTGEIFRNAESPFSLERGERGPKMQIVILAGGVGKRLTTLKEPSKPHILVAGKPILAHVLDGVKHFCQSDVVSDYCSVVIREENKLKFMELAESYPLDLVVPRYEGSAEYSKMNSLLYAMPDFGSDFLIVMNADCIFDTSNITVDVLRNVKENLEKYPFVVVGIETPNTNKRYLINSENEIVGVLRNDGEIPGWRPIGRLFYAIDAARFPCGNFPSFTDVLIRLTSLGCKGKAVILPQGKYYFNINTREDLQKATCRLSS